MGRINWAIFAVWLLISVPLAYGVCTLTSNAAIRVGLLALDGSLLGIVTKLLGYSVFK